MVWTPNAPYNSLPQLPPAQDLESKDILKATIGARAALAGLNQAANRISNPRILLQTLTLLEAQASSEIENIVTTTDDLFRYLDEPNHGASAEVKETLRYQAALFAGIESLKDRPLSANTASLVCSTIQGRQMTPRNLPGTIIADAVTKRAIYTPPSGEQNIRSLLQNWEEFVHSSSSLDPLIIMAVAHYQFEAIHPFADGNGRTGRILNILLLHSAGLLQEPILYLSRYIIRHKSQYYDLLLRVTSEGAWQEWILFILEGVAQTASETLEKIDEITELQDIQQNILRSALSSGSNADLLAVLFEQPYCRISNVMERCEVSRPTATTWLRTLVDHGLLTEIRAGREKLFINHDYLEVLAKPYM